MYSKLFSFLILSIVVASTCGASCSSPKISEIDSFTTQDATIVLSVGHVLEFSLKCSNSEIAQLYAEFECGKIVPVARINNADKYQISWNEEIKKSRSGTTSFRLFDNDGFSSIRKAQRDGGKISSVKSLIDFTVSLPSPYKGPWVNSELVAAIVAISIAYFAFTTKSKLQA